MNTRTIATIIVLAAAAVTPLTAQQSPVFRPGEIWPDTNGVPINAHGGGVLHHEGVYYWFGEHKVGGDAGNYAQVGVAVYASKDLYHWEDKGIALKVSEDPASDITKGCILERPKVIHNPKTGKFVMWFHLEMKGKGYSAARAGVAVADKVTGPYVFKESFRLNAGKWPKDVAEGTAMPGDGIWKRDLQGGQMSRDMTLFVDDDGKAYHITASEDNKTLHISRLTDDFLRSSGEYVRVFPGESHEAPAIFKHRGKYWMFSSHCTGWSPNPGRLSSADSIWGPWQSHGTPCVGPEDRLKTTFDSQSTFVIPVAGKPGAFIFMADRWRPKNAIDGRYVWLPVEFGDDGKPTIREHGSWDLSIFDNTRSGR